MAQKKLVEQTTAELKMYKKQLKLILLALLGVWILLAAIYIYWHVVKSSSLTFIPLIATPLAFLPVYMVLSQVNAELKHRGEQ